MDIFVDIDGTLTVETEGYLYENRTPRFNVIERINSLFDGGHRITLWSARWEEDRRITERWLNLFNVKYHELILGKPKFDLYICDLVKNVEDFV